MSIQEAFEEEGISFPYMNPPTWDGIAEVKKYDNGLWVICPWCGKKLIKIIPETKIHMMPYICKSSSCHRRNGKKEFLVNVE